MIHSHEVSPLFKELLLRAGWSSDRRIETSDWVGILMKEGFKPNSLALNILESVGGLSVRIPPAGINPYEHEIRFDPVNAATGEFDRIEGWEAELGIDLFPIGEEVRNGSIVWVGSNGRLYFGREYGLYDLGESFAIAMDKLTFPTTSLVLCAE